MRLLFLKTCFFLLVLIFSFGPAYLAGAENIIQCHCFTKRVYNPAERFEADEYILATSFNSLLARLADLPKKEIVLLKMNQGVGQDDILIGLRVAGITGRGLQDILDLRRRHKNWQEVVASLETPKILKTEGIFKSILEGASAEMVGSRVAEEMIAGFFSIPVETVKKMGLAGLSEKEITLSLILSHVSEIQPDALIQQYIKQGRSWSEIAYNLGVEPKAAGRLILAYPTKSIPAKD